MHVGLSAAIKHMQRLVTGLTSIPHLSAAAHVLGCCECVMLRQANLWTEYISDELTVEYMLLPRLCALAETLWSAKSSRDWQVQDKLP